MMKLILLSLSLLVFYIQFQAILSCPAKKCDPGYACCVGKECDEGDGGKCYRSCNQIPPSMQEIGSFPPGKIHIQRVLTLCEFHYCEFHYCDFSKKSINLPYANLYLML